MLVYGFEISELSSLKAQYYSQPREAGMQH
jgi:hypothetical protein